MAAERIDITTFIQHAPSGLVIDVRSPKEYTQAHYPGAVSIPLFTDEERAEVGTLYKKKSREEAIKKGLEFYGPKMKSILAEVENNLRRTDQKSVIVYCWRGGMRSAAIAWLLDLYGFKVCVLDGGYKKFRNWVLSHFENPYSLQVLGGHTGSGKTEILKVFARQQLPVIDLEELACHKGSAFGNLVGCRQDSTEQFENRLALTLHQLTETHGTQTPIWVESESSRIGRIRLPHLFFNQMKAATRIDICIPFDKRLDFILKGYGGFKKEALIEATKRLEKRLGGLNMQNTVRFIEEGDLKSAFAILLIYYDKAYDKSAQKFRNPAKVLQLNNTNSTENATIILNELQNKPLHE